MNFLGDNRKIERREEIEGNADGLYESKLNEQKDLDEEEEFV